MAATCKKCDGPVDGSGIICMGCGIARYCRQEHLDEDKEQHSKECLPIADSNDYRAVKPEGLDELEGAGFLFARFGDPRESRFRQFLSWVDAYATYQGKWTDEEDWDFTSGEPMLRILLPIPQEQVDYELKYLDDPDAFTLIKIKSEWNFLTQAVPALAQRLRSMPIANLGAILTVGRRFAEVNDRTRLKNYFEHTLGYTYHADTAESQELYRPFQLDWDDLEAREQFRANPVVSPYDLPAFIFYSNGSMKDPATGRIGTPFVSTLMLRVYRILFPSLDSIVREQRCGAFFRVDAQLHNIDHLLVRSTSYAAMQFRYVLIGTANDTIQFDYGGFWAKLMIYWTFEEFDAHSTAALAWWRAQLRIN